MRLLADVHGYPPGLPAGAEYALSGLFEWLVARGHEARVIASHNACRMGVWNGVRVASTSAVRDEWYAWSDCVLMQLDPVGPIMERCRRHGKPLVLYIHNPDPCNIPALPTVPTLAIFNADWIDRQARWTGQRVLLPPVINRVQYATTRDDAKYVTLINLSALKGAQTLYALARRCPETQFMGVRGGWGAQIVPKDLPANVRIMAMTPDIQSVYRQTRILLAPSETEPWGRVAMEAAASGIPVICSPTPGLRECMGDGATYIDRDDIEGYARQLTILQSPAFYSKASAKASARFTEYEASLPGHLENTEAALERLVSSARSTTAPPAVAETVSPPPSLSYIIPFADSGCPHRKRAYDWVLRYVRDVLCPAFPGEVVTFEKGTADHLAGNRAAMRNLLLDASSGETCIIIDADSYASIDYLRSALAAVKSQKCWCGSEAFAYLTREETGRIYATNRIPESPVPLHFNRHCTGGVLVVPRAAIEAVNGYDEHFVGWGYEDTCFGLSLDILWAPRVRIAGNAGHLWHPERVRPPADSPGRVRMRDTYCMASQKWDVVPGQFVPGDPASVAAMKRIVAGNRVVTGKERGA